MAHAQLVAEFARVPRDVTRCQTLVDQLKVELVRAALASAGRPLDAATLRVSCDVLEMAVLLAVQRSDEDAFDRNVAQLRAYYDAALANGSASLSERAALMLGLSLMRRLAQGVLAVFHAEIERVPSALLAHPCVQFPIKLERYIAEGAFVKVSDAQRDLPDDSYRFFLESLMKTLRERIAHETERAYDSVPVDYAQRLLLLDSRAQLLQLVEQRANWTINGAHVVFSKAVESSDAVSTTTLIKQTIGYARSLERIV